MPEKRSDEIPQPGDVVYIPGEIYIDTPHERDLLGGKALVELVRQEEIPGPNKGTHYLSFKSINGEYRWEDYLDSNQEDLEKEYGDRWAVYLDELLRQRRIRKSHSTFPSGIFGGFPYPSDT